MKNEKEDNGIVIELDMDNDELDQELMEDISSSLENAVDSVFDGVEKDGRPELFVILMSCTIQTALSMEISKEEFLETVETFWEGTKDYLDFVEEEEEENKTFDVN